MRYFLATALMAFCSFAWSGAEAATVTGTFNVQVVIAATCVLNSSTNLNFGTQGVLAAPINNQSTITVTCTNTTPYNIGLDKGLNGGSVTTREMKGVVSAALINYSLFRDAPMTLNWGANDRHGHARWHGKRYGAALPGLWPNTGAIHPGAGHL
jgi:spore coat protein U-like protein